mgnify:CR=1 FL=1
MAVVTCTFTLKCKRAFHPLFVAAKLPWAMLAQRTLFTRAWKNLGRSLSTQNRIHLSMTEELPG